MTKVVTIQAQQRWEYACESRRTENALLQTLNELGQHGWELVDAQHHKDPKGDAVWTAFLKRPIAGHVAVEDGAPHEAVVAPTPPPVAGERPSEFQGFDLSGDEFQIKTD
jgi:hypothetical protein